MLADPDSGTSVRWFFTGDFDETLCKAAPYRSGRGGSHSSWQIRPQTPSIPPTEADLRHERDRLKLKKARLRLGLDLAEKFLALPPEGSSSFRAGESCPDRVVTKLAGARRNWGGCETAANN